MSSNFISRNCKTALLICGILYAPFVCSQSDSAFTISPGTLSAAMQIHEGSKILERNQKILFGSNVKSSLSHSTDKLNQLTSTVVPRSSGGEYVKKVVLHYPPESRAQVAKVFNSLLTGYSSIETQFGVEHGDLAGAVAAFLVGSYMGYRNVDFPDENFKPLVNQMRKIIGANADYARASLAEKQEMYEQMALLGVYMATTQMALKERPDPQIASNMKQAAKGYLEQFLKADADRVQITAQGLVIR